MKAQLNRLSLLIQGHLMGRKLRKVCCTSESHVPSHDELHEITQLRTEVVTPREFVPDL